MAAKDAPTPGKWEWRRFDEAQVVVIAKAGPKDMPLVAVCTGPDREANAKFLCAAKARHDLEQASRNVPSLTRRHFSLEMMDDAGMWWGIDLKESPQELKRLNRKEIARCRKLSRRMRIVRVEESTARTVMEEI
jgi:hypothetical protein